MFLKTKSTEALEKRIKIKSRRSREMIFTGFCKEVLSFVYLQIVEIFLYRVAFDI